MAAAITGSLLGTLWMWLKCDVTEQTRACAVAEIGDRLATIDMGRKVGAAVPLSRRGSWVPI